MSTLVGDSVSTLTERLSELEHTMHSRTTTPVTEDIVTRWKRSTIEQALMSELGKLREDCAEEIPRLYELCEKLHENQKSQERQLTGLRSFAQHVERFLDQLDRGATAPSDSHQVPTLERGRASVPLGCAWCFCFQLCQTTTLSSDPKTTNCPSTSSSPGQRSNVWGERFTI